MKDEYDIAALEPRRNPYYETLKKQGGAMVNVITQTPDGPVTRSYWMPMTPRPARKGSRPDAHQDRQTDHP